MDLNTKNKQLWIISVVIGVLLLVVSGFIGYTVGNANVKVQTIEKEIEVPVEVEVTPNSCLEYIDLSEKAFSYLGLSIQAVVKNDYIESQKYIDEINEIKPIMLAAKEECRKSE